MPVLRTTRITRLDQMTVLASPLRQELLDVLARMGTVSLAEVAAALGRAPDGLYYHVRLLQRAGLVESAGARRGGGRPEALFRATASEYALRYPTRSATQARAVGAIVAGMLRLGIRDFRRAFADPGNRLEGPSRDVWALRTTGWLLPRDVRAVNRRIVELREATSRAGRGGRLYGVTVLLTPLSRRGPRIERPVPRIGRRGPRGRGKTR
jgi:DNA-binding transcriptional ArsR family regulator